MSSIYINGRFLTRPMSGVERYAYMICKTMVSLGVNYSIVCPKAPLHSCYDTKDLPIVYFGHGQSHLWEQCILPFFFIGKKDYLVFNFTGLGPILTRHKVMTIHDLSFLENPKWFSRGYYWWYKTMTPLAARTSRHIITVSEFSKQEILKYYHFLKEQDITVINCAPDETKFFLQQQATKPKEKYALAVSSLDPRKNFDSLIASFSDIKDCKLFIVGGGNRLFTKQGYNSCEDGNIQFLGRVSDEQLLHLYNQATCFIFPSVYEGFGIPPIEAMCCGCPVLASDIPVIHEVCGEAAIYFNPHNVEDMKNTIQHYLQEEQTLRPIMAAKGLSNKQRFSWVKTTQAVLQLFQLYKNT